MKIRGRAWVFWGLGVAAASALVRLPSLNLLLDRDEGEYATLGWLWRSGAGLPYRDWLEQKPPLAWLVNAWAQAWFPDGVGGLRLLALLWVAATALALFAVVDAVGRRGGLGSKLASDGTSRLRAAGLAGLAAALLLSACRSQGIAANTETWQTLPLVLAVGALFAGPDSPGPRRCLAAGLGIIAAWGAWVLWEFL